MSEFTDRYKDFSAKMDTENEDLKGLLKQYKEHIALGQGFATPMMRRSVGDIANGRTAPDFAGNMMKTFTAGDEADIQGNKELMNRYNTLYGENLKTGDLAAKEQHYKDWNNVMQQKANQAASKAKSLPASTNLTLGAYEEAAKKVKDYYDFVERHPELYTTSLNMSKISPTSFSSAKQEAQLKRQAAINAYASTPIGKNKTGLDLEIPDIGTDSNIAKSQLSNLTRKFLTTHNTANQALIGSGMNTGRNPLNEQEYGNSLNYQPSIDNLPEDLLNNPDLLRQLQEAK